MNRRILILNFPLSGINKYLFSQLREKGWEFTIIDVPFSRIHRFWAIISTFSPNMSLWKKRFSKKYAKLNKSSWTFLYRTKYCEKKIRELKGKFDVILQISGMFAPFLEHNNNLSYVTFNDYTMALSKKYPYWMPFDSQIQKWLDLETKLYKNASYVFTTSENTRNSLINDYDIESKKVVNVGYGITIDFIPEVSKVYDGKTILFIGKDFKRKGGLVLLEAFQKVREEIKDAKLIIVGPSEDIYNIKKPGVELLGSIENREMVKNLYEKASIFAMPSFCEPFGLVFLEAMGYRLPCIGATVDAMPEIIENGKTGFLVPPGDVNSLTDKILTLLNNVELSKNMGINGYERLKLKFRWESVGEKIDHYLKECLQEKRNV